jgi:hypothetical protein
MGSDSGETVLPMVELVRGSLGLSIASRPLCPLTLQALLSTDIENCTTSDTEK